MGGCKAAVWVLLVALLAIFVSVEGQGRGAVPPVVAAPAPLTPAPAPMDLAPAPEPAPLWPPCDGVDLVYVNTRVEKIFPYLNETPWLQPYKFEAQVTVTNMGYSTVEGWAIGMNFSNGEVRGSNQAIG